MENKISSKFKNSYEDEYDALYEAVFGESNADREPFGTEDQLHDEEDLTECTDKFCFVEDKGASDSTWSRLPDLLLERIYSYLTIKERYYASMVCRSWYEAFHLSNVWRTFVFNDKTLTRRLFTYYSDWQVRFHIHDIIIILL